MVGVVNMAYQHDIQDEIDSYETYLTNTMPDDIRELIAKANNDLYSGPSYYDADGNECSCFDEGAVPFDFRAACKRISAWASDVEDVRVSVFYENEDDEEGELIVDSEHVDGSARVILRNILGRELASYV
jgi:hypothetical protein